GVVIDTHFSARGRLGRLAGILARVVEEEAPARLLGLGLDERTGLVLRGAEAEVIGEGAVTVLDPSSAGPAQRPAGRPLHWSGLGLHRLTEGFRLDLDDGHIEAPAEAEAVAWDGRSGSTEGEWLADGDRLSHEERFAVVVQAEPYSSHAGTDLPVLADAVGVLDAHRSDRRYGASEALFRVLYDHVGYSGFLVGEGGSLERLREGEAQVAAVDNPESGAPAMAGLVVDSSGLSLRALALLPSGAGDGSLQTAALVGLRLHVLYSPVGGQVYNTVTRSVEAPEP
ncbi:MAG TPA: hypothetical protein PKY30_23745, partial [Myxococcota bacterium]|nr:hypothetical protein [Myxococcota bacterium]